MFAFVVPVFCLSSSVISAADVPCMNNAGGSSELRDAPGHADKDTPPEISNGPENHPEYESRDYFESFVPRQDLLFDTNIQLQTSDISDSDDMVRIKTSGEKGVLIRE